MDVAALLERALVDLRGGEPVAALDHVLAAWRAAPTPRLAALIESVSDRAEQGTAKIPGATIKAKVAAAAALANAHAAIDLPRVMRVLPEVRIADATQLARGMTAWLPDPRYTREVIALLRAWPWGASTSRTLWRVLLGNLAAARDPRADDALAALDLATIVDTDFGTRMMAELVVRVRKKLAAANLVAPPADPADAALLAALEAELASSGRSGAELLAAIYAQPHDRAPRAVYADWLAERDDPRGEFITLQLAAAPSDEQRRRERALVAEHGDDWLGPINSAVHATRRRFAGGFLAAAELQIERAYAVADATEWATLEAAWTGRPDDDARAIELFALPRFPGLRFLGDLSSEQAEPLARLARPLAGLGFEFPYTRGAVLALERDFVASIARPEVREVAFDNATPDQLDWFWATRLGAQITRLRASSGMKTVPAWLAQGAVPPHVASVEVSFDFGWFAWTLELARGADGKLSRIAAVLRPSIRGYEASKAIDLVEDLFDAIADDALEHFALRLDGTSATKSELAKIAAALARQTRLVSHALPGDTPLPAAKRAAKPAQVARAEAAQAARAEFARAVAALPERVGYLEALDFGDRVACEDVVRYFGQLLERPPVHPAYADVCWAILGLPIRDDDADRARRARAAAIDVLALLAPAGAFARVTALLERGATAGDTLVCIPTVELPQLLDWFEKRRKGTAPPPADAIYQLVATALARRGDAGTIAELARRLDDKKLGRYARWAYETAIRDARSRTITAAVPSA